MKVLVLFVVLGVALLVFSGVAMNQPLKIIENLRQEQVALPPEAPEKDRMVLQDTLAFLEKNGAAGILFFYDDIRTKWEIDYIEFYDLEGNLLLVTWLDRLGRCQVAMKSGLLDADNPSARGIWVMIPVGTPA